MTATLTKWYQENGRHEIFAGGKAVGLPTTEHSLDIRPDLVAAEAQQDLVKRGVARNAREEKAQARDEQRQALESQRMAALYRQHVLGQPPAEPLIQLEVRRQPGPSRPEPGATPRA